MTRARGPRDRRRVAAAFVAASVLLIPALFFLLCELSLFLFGVKPLALTEDPHYGFDAGQPLFVKRDRADGSAVFETNPVKLSHFNFQSFPARKAPGAYRIFALGGSTTYGHPWRDSTSFSAWLRELLPGADSARRYEVVNCGGISYASYRVANLAEELIGYEPDLFVVYNGHNEFLEERTYRSVRRLPVWMRALSSRLDRTRTYSALRRALRAAEPGARMPAEVDEVLGRTIGPSSYARDDALRQRVLEHYHDAQARIALLARAAGARTIFLSTPSNEGDCSPFKSEPTPGLTEAAGRLVAAWTRAGVELLDARPAEARTLLDSAARADPRNAEVLYLAGRAAMALKRYAEAKALFTRALDEDVCPLRALPAMRDIERRVARETGSGFVDFARVLEEATRARAGHTVLGEPDFADHVHLSVENYGLMAMEIISAMTGMGVLPAGARIAEADEARARAAVLSRLNAGEEGLGYHNIAKVLNWAGKRADAGRAARRGLEKDTVSLESIWSSLFVGAELERQGLSERALPHYRRALRLDSGNAETLRLLGDALLRIGDTAEGERHLEAAVRRDPGNARLRERTGRLAYARGRYADAARHLGAAANGNAAGTDARVMLAGALMATGNPLAAERELRAAVSGDSGSAEAWMALGFVVEQRGRPGEAVKHYRRALTLNPRLEPARRALGRFAGAAD